MATNREVEDSATALVNKVARVPDPGYSNYKQVISAYKSILVDAIALIREVARNADEKDQQNKTVS